MFITRYRDTDKSTVSKRDLTSQKDKFIGKVFLLSTLPIDGVMFKGEYLCNRWSGVVGEVIDCQYSKSDDNTMFLVSHEKGQAWYFKEEFKDYPKKKKIYKHFLLTPLDRV